MRPHRAWSPTHASSTVYGVLLAGNRRRDAPSCTSQSASVGTFVVSAPSLRPLITAFRTSHDSPPPDRET